MKSMSNREWKRRGVELMEKYEKSIWREVWKVKKHYSNFKLQEEK